MKCRVNIATKDVCNPFDEGFTVRVGQRPVAVRSKKGVRKPRPWQADALKTLWRVRLGILNAPPGSGKSAVQRILATLWAMDKCRVIIAVPDSFIGSTFVSDSAVYELPDKSETRWRVSEENVLFEDPKRLSPDGVTDRIVRFVRDRLSADPNKRILVCTHSALVRAHAVLLECGDWRDTAVIIDEAHHSMWSEDERPRQGAKDGKNALGAVIEHLVAKKNRVLMVTATWMRGDAESVIPNSVASKFTLYERPAGDHLDEMWYLRKISFRMWVGDPAKLLREIVLEDPQAKTLVHMQPVAPGDRSKMERLQKLLGTLGPARVTGDGFAIHTISRGIRVTSVDLVTSDGRGKVRNLFNEAKDNPDGPSLAIVQNLGREGFDWPSCSRSVVIGARGSLPLLIQTISRPLRDVEGKEHAEINFIVDPSRIKTDIGQFESYVGAILNTMMLGWFFQASLPDTLRSQRALSAVMGKIRQAIRSGRKSANDVIRDAIRDAVDNISDEDVERSAKSLLSCMKGAFRIAVKAAGKLTPGLAREIDIEPMSAAEVVFEAQFGKEIYAKWRNSLFMDRTMKDVDHELLEYFEEKEKRPTCDTHPALEAWLQNRGSSVARRCNELGIPGGRNLHRTMKSVDQELLTYYRENNRRPSGNTHRNIECWLWNRGSSIHKRCNALGMNTNVKYNRTMKSVDQELLTYCRKNRRRPTPKTHGALNAWLRLRGSSLYKRCNELGIGYSPICRRTIGDVDRELLTFSKKNKIRPTCHTHPLIDSWLRRRGSSVAKRCNELGMK